MLTSLLQPYLQPVLPELQFNINERESTFHSPYKLSIQEANGFLAQHTFALIFSLQINLAPQPEQQMLKEKA